MTAWLSTGTPHSEASIQIFAQSEMIELRTYYAIQEQLRLRALPGFWAFKEPAAETTRVTGARHRGQLATKSDRVEKPTAGLLGIGGRDKTRCTEPRASASGRQPRAKVTSDSLTLAVPCSTGVEFFMGFRGPKAQPNRPGGLSHQLICRSLRLARRVRGGAIARRLRAVVAMLWPRARFLPALGRLGSGARSRSGAD